KVWLIAGSLPERDNRGRIYNTSFVFNREGQMITRHRKIHLFSIDVPGGQYFQESDTLTAGDTATVFATEFGAIGLCVCFDFRFPELARKMALDGAKIIVVPGAFNQTTGPAHWELMFRSRAVDNQLFTLGCAPARNLEATYQSWGHSILVDPWGSIVTQLDDQTGQIVATIDLDAVEKTRLALPLLKNRRPDIY
ncbi:MAG: carbon-nitrogen hydrolase family protein, partial [Eubacteriales bacterium]|nr:carbon-nitrogen hydrolase family protein [Eubacteriales bacterium]